MSWSEVEDALATHDPWHLVFLADDVIERVGRLGDLFAPALEIEQELPEEGTRLGRSEPFLGLEPASGAVDYPKKPTPHPVHPG